MLVRRYEGSSGISGLPHSAHIRSLRRIQSSETVSTPRTSKTELPKRGGTHQAMLLAKKCQQDGEDVKASIQVRHSPSQVGTCKRGKKKKNCTCACIAEFPILTSLFPHGRMRFPIDFLSSTATSECSGIRESSIQNRHDQGQPEASQRQSGVEDVVPSPPRRLPQRLRRAAQ